jgi:uncharacterized membrane protein YkvA (DUF1232 family)
MPDDWNRPLTKAEMDAIRRAAGVEPSASRNERKVRANFWARFAKVARHIPFAEDVLAAFYCATDTKTPLQVRAVLFAALVYFLWPSSLIPRLALTIGLLDETAVLLATIRTLGGAIRPEHRAHAHATLHPEAQAA